MCLAIDNAMAINESKHNKVRSFRSAPFRSVQAFLVRCPDTVHARVRYSSVEQQLRAFCFINQESVLRLRILHLEFNNQSYCERFDPWLGHITKEKPGQEMHNW